MRVALFAFPLVLAMASLASQGLARTSLPTCLRPLPGGHMLAFSKSCLAISIATKYSPAIVDYDPRFSAVILKCSRVDGIKVSQRLGTFRKNGRISCSLRPKYSYLIDERFECDISKIKGKIGCFKNICSFVFAIGNNVFLSAAIRKHKIGNVGSINLLPTKLNFNFNGLLQVFADRTAHAFKGNISDPMTLRALVFFSGSTKNHCYSGISRHK